MLPSAFRSLVSTHSRTKAAALDQFEDYRKFQVSTHSRTKAAAYLRQRWNKRKSVSTHSRTKAAALNFTVIISLLIKFQHTAARRRLHSTFDSTHWYRLFQHTAARRRLPPADRWKRTNWIVSTHSRTKAAASSSKNHSPSHAGFQHTAARRRLQNIFARKIPTFFVSTHSRAEAAALCKQVF